jgi:hypothetical protein
MNPTIPCVLLYNPISGHGHLDSWSAMFVALLLDAGWRVNVATPDAADLRVRLTRKDYVSHPNLNILDWNTSRRSLLQRAVGRLRRIIAPQTISIELDIDPRYLDPFDLGQRLAIFKKKSKWRPSIIFNMYMDMYAPDQKRWALFETVNPLPWAGIRFVPSVTGTEAYYQLPSLAGMCFLNEAIQKKYQALMPSKAFGYLPDITENALPPTQTDLVTHIKAQAQSRAIVFLGGTLGGNKNLAKWYELIALADPSKWYFVQIGEMFENTLTPEDAQALAKVTEQCPANLFIKREYLPDEAAFNEVIAASNIIFAVYRNFTVSSNMPGKAAAFEKPILVAEGHLMGQRVKQYGIGLAVPENDVEQMYMGLQQLRQNQGNLNDNFEAYRKDFSPQALGNHLTATLQMCLTKSHQGAK